MKKLKKLDAVCAGCNKKVKIEDVERFQPWLGTDGGYMIHHKGQVCDPGRGLGGSFLVWLHSDGVWRKEKENK